MTARKNILYLTVIIILFLSIEGLGFYIGVKESGHSREKADQRTARLSISTLKARTNYLKYNIQSLVPESVYIVIDSAKNRLYLKRGLKVIREAVVSCGSGNVLKDPSGKRQWVFDTPRGVFTVKSKYVSPIWTKPDWGFIEEGEKIPTSIKARREEGVLGNYSLGFGNGYFIHGTLYTRLLGRSVTHGCIRVGDADLKTVFNTAEIGTQIFIF
ncbi:MAG: hypothetical protein A2Y66_01300 [Nitrospirae bacterium RBG_13_41_22]|nr:MAG: hypothetical protein A2Y66_01300 [Nitrospirae bacterium RBG_13_41_22]